MLMQIYTSPVILQMLGRILVLGSRIHVVWRNDCASWDHIRSDHHLTPVDVATENLQKPSMLRIRGHLQTILETITSL